MFTTSLADDHYANLDGSKLNKNKPKFSTQSQKRGSGAVTFYAMLKGQASPENLDAPGKIDQCEIYASAYYPEKKMYADQGYILNLEARIDLPEFVEQLPGLVQLIVFVDTNAIAMNQYALVDGLNRTTISGAGIGINWRHADNFELKAYFANKLDNEVFAITPNLANLYWIQAVKYF